MSNQGYKYRWPLAHHPAFVQVQAAWPEIGLKEYLLKRHGEGAGYRTIAEEIESASKVHLSHQTVANWIAKAKEEGTEDGSTSNPVQPSPAPEG